MLIQQGRVYARNVEDAIDKIEADLLKQGLVMAGDLRIWHALVQDKLPEMIWYEYNVAVAGVSE